jgi:hypothetical protein
MLPRLNRKLLDHTPKPMTKKTITEDMNRPMRGAKHNNASPSHATNDPPRDTKFRSRLMTSLRSRASTGKICASD